MTQDRQLARLTKQLARAQKAAQKAHAELKSTANFLAVREQQLRESESQRRALERWVHDRFDGRVAYAIPRDPSLDIVVTLLHTTV
jgi:septal ring factor EnvC (AmiA/AmiB activator)